MNGLNIVGNSFIPIGDKHQFEVVIENSLDNSGKKGVLIAVHESDPVTKGSMIAVALSYDEIVTSRIGAVSPIKKEINIIKSLEAGLAVLSDEKSFFNFNTPKIIHSEENMSNTVEEKTSEVCGRTEGQCIEVIKTIHAKWDDKKVNKNAMKCDNCVAEQ